MNREQKIAWCFVITILLGVILSAIAFTILYVKVGIPKARAGFGFLGIAGLGVIPALLFRKDKGKVTFDERDRLIRRTAALGGFASAYLFVGMACMIPWSILGKDGTISVRWLPLIWVGTFITHFLVYSVAILVQYGRGGKDGQE